MGAGILSVTTPGVPIAGTGDKARALARSINEYFGNVTIDPALSADRLGFFGALPDFRDVDGTLAEIDYLYGEQKLSHGVMVASSYGDKGLGDATFKPIWERLNSYKALVFLHPTTLPGVEPTFLAGGLPQPIVDFPLATTRAAVDFVFSGRFGECPDVDVILSHAGGTLPYIGSRVQGSLAIPDVGNTVPIDAAQATRDFARFYYDIALSTSPAQLDGLLHFTDPSKIVFGSDFPYVGQTAIDALVLQYAGFVASSPRGKKIAPEVLRRNALDLLRRHEQGKKFGEDDVPEVQDEAR